MMWRDVVSRGTTYAMNHLHPFTTGVKVGSRQIDLHVTFGFHVFTDEKGKGAEINLNGERRFFCPARHADSHQAVHFMQTRVHETYTRPYIAPSKNQQFFVMDIHDYAIFLAIQKPVGTINELKCKVVSAYTVDQWGRHSLPTRAKLQKMSFVLDRREQGLKIPM